MSQLFQTVKSSNLNNGTVLRLACNSELVYFIFLETTITEKKPSHEIAKGDRPLEWKKIKKEMLWNGILIDDANHTFDSLKNNPLLNGDCDNCPGCGF